jgi:hypothetical protein
MRAQEDLHAMATDSSADAMARREELEHAIKRGIEMADDPLNAARKPHEPRITTLYSPWLLQTCRMCRHSFREEDQVLPDPHLADAMLHEDPQAGLFCWSKWRGLTPTKPSAPPLDAAVREDFMRGVRQHWKPAGNLAVELVQRGMGLVGRRCPICRHTVRLGDHVVRCPCGRGCNGVFHQDLTRHLTCWDTWNRGSERAFCAFTQALYARPTADEVR